MTAAATHLRAFHGDPDVKATYLARVEAHRQADEIVQGVYWEHGKGCAVGCTIHSDDHARYETELGVPTTLARLQDRIFEGLPRTEAKEFPAAFLAAIPVGADLTKVAPRFLYALILRRRAAVDAETYPQIVAAMDQVLVVLKAWGETGVVDQRAAASAAASAADSAARAAYSAASAAARAAYSAASAAEYCWMARALLQLLREAA